MPEKIDGIATVMNPPATRFVPQPTSKQKDTCKDIRCAEIKTIPSMKNSDQERSPKTFKIGEYNRATASFEIPSVRNTPVAEVEAPMTAFRPEFDFSADFASDQFFQSAFARSVASSQSKSMDYGSSKNSANGNSDKLSPVNCATRNTDVQQNWQLPGKEVSFALFSLSRTVIFYSADHKVGWENRIHSANICIYSQLDTYVCAIFRHIIIINIKVGLILRDFFFFQIYPKHQGIKLTKN